MPRTWPAFAQARRHSLCVSPLAPFTTQQPGSTTSPTIVLIPLVTPPFGETGAGALASFAAVAAFAGAVAFAGVVAGVALTTGILAGAEAGAVVLAGAAGAA